MPPEENRALDNLVLLCIEHSYEIDEAPELFPPETLREWKAAQVAEYDRLQRNWPINDDEVAEVLVASESFDALHAPAIVELARRVEALRLAATRTRTAARSWSRKWQQANERARQSFTAWDDEGNPLYLQPSYMELLPIKEGLQAALAAALVEVQPAAESAQIEIAAVRVTRTQMAPWCEALDRAITNLVENVATWSGGPDPQADNVFEDAIATLQQSATDLGRASRGEQVDLPEPQHVAAEQTEVDPLAAHRILLDEARPFSRVDHLPYNPELRESVAVATGQAAAIPFAFHFLTIGLDTTASLAMSVARNASDEELLDLVERDRTRLPICAAAALLQAATLRGDGENAPAHAARENLRRLWSESDWSSETSWVGNDVNGRQMMQAFARVTSDEQVRDCLSQALETNPELLETIVVSCAGWSEERDSHTWAIVGLERDYPDTPPWLPIETIKAMALDVFGGDRGLDEKAVLAAVLQKSKHH
ncbi:hypothetical protein ASE48_16190 [Mycobacterium sp. Root265]|nr:hypothetical protein ASE48_16190 [Mycobacterium sp. Root265]